MKQDALDDLRLPARQNAEITHPHGVCQDPNALFAFRNAFWQLLNAEATEAGVIDTVMRGGDTDTNAAICGALLGAVHGKASIPARWIDRVLTCRPSSESERVVHPRPEYFWPVDALTLAERLVC